MSINKKDVAAILIFVALIVAFVLLINNITTKNSGRELQIVRDAVKNAATFQVCENKLPYVYFEMQDIPAAKLDKLQKFAIGGQTYYYSVLDFAKSLLDISRPDSQKDLGKATYWYKQAANEFFDD